MSEITSAQIAWAAGLIEGEGSISLDGPYRRTPRLVLGMTDKDVVEKFKDTFKFSNRIYTRVPKPGYKPYHTLVLTGKNAVGLMFTLFPFLGARRREQIRNVVSVWKSSPGKKGR